MEKLRGVVISPGFKSLGPGSFSADSAGIQGLLRKCLLYWDLIDWPTNNLVHLGSGPDEEFLESAGILRRTRIVFTGTFSGDLTPVFAQGQLKVFEELERREPGAWSLAQSSDTLRFPQQSVSERRSIKLHLNNALPVPADTVSFQDILEFRQRYASELSALRAVMDEMCSEAADLGDVEQRRKIAVGRLRTALDDVTKSLCGRNILHSPVSVSIDIKVRDVIRDSLVGSALLMHQFGVPIPLGGALAAAASAVSSLKFQVANVRTPDSARVGPFAYLYHVKRELE